MSTRTMTDGELVGQVLAGRREAFTGLVERYVRAATAVARVRLANPVDAEDAVQETFLRAFERLGTLHDRAKFGPWLLTIARHEAVRIDARRHTTAGTNLEPSEHATEPDPARAELGEIVRERVSGLPETSREVLMLHYFAGHTTREIANMLDIRQAAVLKRLQRARDQLAENLLNDLEAARPNETSLGKQIARIMALTATATSPAIVWNSATAALLTVPRFAMMTAAALFLTGTILISQDRGKGELSIPATSESARATEPNLAGNGAISGDAGLDAARSFDALFLQANRPAPNEATPALAQETDEHDLTGYWQLLSVDFPSVKNAEETLGAEFWIRDFQFEQLGTTIKINPAPDDASWKGGRFTVVGDRLTMDLVEDHPPMSRIVAHAEGSRGSEENQLKLNGWVRVDTLPRTGLTNGEEGTPIAARFWWQRKSVEMIAEGNYRRKRNRELEEIYQALLAYANDHTQRMPEEINELVPRYLPNLVHLSAEDGILYFEYAPMEYLASREQIMDLFHRAIRPIPDDPESERTNRVELEGFLQRFYRRDNSGRRHEFLKVVYDQYDLEIVLEPFRNGNHSCAGARLAGATKDELSEKCSQGMQETANAVISFMNAWHRAPQGWLPILTWNLSVCSLYCPGDKSERIGRELLFPFASVKDLMYTYETLFGSDGEPRTYEEVLQIRSRIPIVIETDHCGDASGRHVAFLDGHVEFREGRLEDHPDIAPFLNLK